MGNMENIKNENKYPEGSSLVSKLEAKLLKMNAEIKELEDKNKGLEVNKIESEAKIKKLEEENKELEEIIKNKDKLLRIIAHDLRSPLSTVIGLSDVLKDRLKSEKNGDDASHNKTIHFADMMHTQSHRTFKVLEDLSKWVNSQNPEILTMDLFEQIEKGINALKITAEQKGINLDNLITEKINIKADPSMLQTVIRNLINNAIKFNNKGGSISIYSEKKGNVIEISVADDGVGLEEDIKQRIFKDVIKSTYGTEGEGGTGLGLSICKEFIEKMNGTIRVESEGKNKGTKFIITLPAGEEVKKEQ